MSITYMHNIIIQRSVFVFFKNTFCLKKTEKRFKCRSDSLLCVTKHFFPRLYLFINSFTFNKLFRFFWLSKAFLIDKDNDSWLKVSVLKHKVDVYEYVCRLLINLNTKKKKYFKVDENLLEMISFYQFDWFQKYISHF